MLLPATIVVSPVGTKRVVHAVTDCVVLTVHKTDKTQADDELERELIEFDELAKYDINNKPKSGVQVAELEHEVALCLTSM